jgi:hypothetical protein
MKRRPNHRQVGLLFVFLCVAIACLVYALMVNIRSNNNAPATTAADNVMTTDLTTTPGSDEVPTDAAPAISEEAASNTDGADLGACRSEVCSWSKTLSSSEVARKDGSRLIDLTLLGGEAPDVEHPRIRWNTEAHHVWVFCSTTLPVTIIRSDDAYQVDVLDFVTGIPSVLDSSAAIYQHTCHPRDDRLFDQPLQLGYHPVAPAFQEISVNDPSEIWTKETDAAHAPEATVE